MAGSRAQQGFGRIPAQATIGYGDAVTQVATQWLAAFEQMTFEHHPDQGPIPAQALFKHIVEYIRLTQRILTTVCVAAIDHQTRGNAVFLQPCAGVGHVGVAEIWATVPTPQDQMSIRVAGCQNDCRMALFIHAEMTMAVCCTAHGITRNRYPAVRAIFEAHGQVQAAGHFPVDLRFGRASANGRPAQQVVEVASSNRLQQFCRDRKPHA